MRFRIACVGYGPDSVRSRNVSGWSFGFAKRELHPAGCGGAAAAPSTSLLRETATMSTSETAATEKRSGVEVKIGVTDSPRELAFNSAQSPSEVEELVTGALSKDQGVLALTDEKGRRFLVQTARIAYVEIGAADVRRVGFGVGAESA